MMAFQHAYESDSEHAGEVEITGRILRATTKAILFDDGVSQQWLPLSKIKRGDEDSRGVLPVFMPKWLAKEKKYV